ncbi:hypothetical protein O9993_11310 [Vibrio lentus]|nr:hypothetical protein [Vibrio lentus]
MAVHVEHHLSKRWSCGFHSSLLGAFVSGRFFLIRNTNCQALVWRRTGYRCFISDDPAHLNGFAFQLELNPDAVVVKLGPV